jgi:MFS transporter, PPP family, 3-phenylpropionic acid transporter
LPDLGTLLSDRTFLGFLVCSGLTWAAHSSYDLCSSLFFRDLGAAKNTIGLLWALGILLEIVLMANAEPLFRRLSSTRLLVVAYAGSALRWFGMSQLTSVTAAFVLQPLHALSFGLMWLASLEYLRRWSTRGLLASAQGIFMAAVALGSVAGILVWGPLYERSGGPAVFASAGTLALFTAVIGAASLRREELVHRFVRNDDHE